MINRQNSPLFAQGKSKWEAFVSTYCGPYDFSKSVYAGMNKKVTFFCPKHGVMTSDAKNLMAGKECIKCSIETRAGKRRMTQKTVISRFKEVHKEVYDYGKVHYRDQKTPVCITCTRHGDFLQMPEFHWGGAGCPRCFHEDRRGASQRMSHEEFLRRVEEMFPGKFLVQGHYVNSQTEISLVCMDHDLQLTSRPNWLLSGNDPCGKCNHMKSAPEDAVAAYLSIFTTVEQRNRSLIGPKELDIYLPEHNIAVEFCGMYWHSHTDRADEKKNKNRHAEKHRLCAEQGIRLITIYETEWQERPETVKRMLRNAIGKTKGKLMARKCELRSVGRPEAVAFYEKYHPQGGAGSGTHYGLYHKGKLVACMRFTYGGNDRGHGAQSRQWTLSRYASRISVAGAASRLFKAFLREHEPETVKSFSDNRLFGGGMYAQLGFDLEADVVPDYQVWSQKLGLRPKPHYQRRLLPARIKDHGVDEVFDPKTDPRTEAEMTYLMGARRIYDCGKKRWVWTAR